MIAWDPSIIWRLIVVQEVVASVNVQFLKLSHPTAELSMHVLNFAYFWILSMLGIVNPFYDGMPLW